MGQVRVFLSYSRQDSAEMERVVRDLRAAGAEVWVDVASITDGNFMQRINEGLGKCEWFVVILTPHALQSPAVRTEVDTAILLHWNRKLQGVIPFLAAPCNPDDVPPTWRILQHYDATRDYASALGGLLHAIGLAPQSFQAAASADGVPPFTAASSPAMPPTLPRGGGPEAAGRPWMGRASAVPPSVATAVAPRPQSYPQPQPQHPPARPAPPRTPEVSEALKQLGFTTRAFGALDIVVGPTCPVEAGTFLMGSDPQIDPQSDANELPQHRIELSAYRIARFPVTVVEYARAVAVGAVRPPLIANGISWEKQLDSPEHPVRGVLWQDALLYAHWLTSLTGQVWRLPTEAEWEKAARGVDGRTFPWGNSWDPRRANTGASNIHGTTPVGRYPSGASPFGLNDACGNVLEWCSTILEPYPYRADATRENLNEPTNRRVLRGGAWGLSERYARAAARIYLVSTDMVLGLVGFRLALSGIGDA